MIPDNPLLNTDSYKFSHHLQYPGDTVALSAHIEARGHSLWPEVVFFGLQMFLKDMMQRPVTRRDVAEAEELATLHGLPFNREGWLRIVSRFSGYMPVRIEALPEGLVVPRGLPLVQITSTDHETPWVATWLDTALLRAVWYPSTVASNARRLRDRLLPFYENTTDPDQVAIETRLHDFGARAATSREQSALGGAAHLLFFERTDTLSALVAARNFYGAPMAGRSFPASEHSTMTAWGQAREAEAFGMMLDSFARYGTVSIVSDSYDLSHAVTEIWGKVLREEVIRSGALVIVRPDSGDPVDTPVQVVQQLAYAFGTRLNSRGYKVIEHGVRVMQGDGVALADMEKILGRMEAMGFSADNIYFGVGSNLMQKVNRDQFSFTMKANARQAADGRWIDMGRRPANLRDRPQKTGRLAVVNDHGELSSVRLDDLGRRENLLAPVYQDGNLLVDWSFEEVRERARRIIR